MPAVRRAGSRWPGGYERGSEWVPPRRAGAGDPCPALPRLSRRIVAFDGWALALGIAQGRMELDSGGATHRSPKRARCFSTLPPMRGTPDDVNSEAGKRP